MNTKEQTLKNFGNQVAIGFHHINKKPTKTLKMSYFMFHRRKESHTGLEC